MFIPRTDGLSTGAEVRLNGMTAGRVGKIALVENPADPDRSICVTRRVVFS